MSAKLQTALPQRMDDLSCAWLSAALSQRYPGTEVQSFHVGTVINGTATKVRLLLTYNEEGHLHRLPPTMWLKGGFEKHSVSREQSAVYAGEAAFYGELSEQFDIGCPAVYFAHTCPHTGASALLIEDLMARNVRFGSVASPVSVEEAQSFLALLARLHARHWGSSALDIHPWLMNGGALGRGNVISNVFCAEPNWSRCLALPRGRFVPAPLRDRERVAAVIDQMLRSDRDQAHCLVHGDAHLGNTFTEPDGTVGFLDWQTPMKGHWAHDVSYFFTTSLAIDDRRHAESDLLAHYLDQLRHLDVQNPPSQDQAWLEYRRHAVYPLCWAVCPPEQQAEVLCEAVAERVGAAVLELESFEAWGH